MKLLVVSNMYPSEKFPVYGLFVKRIVDSLVNLGANVSYAVMTKQQGRLTKILAYITFVLNCRKAIKQGNYDLVYVHYMAHSLLPLLGLKHFYQGKLVIHAHGSDVTHTSIANSIIRRLISRCVYDANAIISPSEFFTGKILKAYPKQNLPIFVSPSGGVAEIFCPIQNPSQTNQTFNIGIVSRLDHGKGVATFLKALKLLNAKGIPFKANIIGDGSQRAALIALAAYSNLDHAVTFHGALSGDSLVSQYQQFNVFLFPTELPESLGLVGLEAMACGVPVIGSNVGGIPSYLQDKVNGLLFNPGDANDLCDKILCFYNSPNTFKEELVYNARSTAEAYKAGNVAKVLFDRLNELIHAKS